MTDHPFRILDPARAAEAGPRDLVLERSAFGGGSHPTTAACLALLAGLGDLAGRRVLDLGCGTGILGLAALRRGAASALLCDVSPEAVASAGRNAAANGLADRAHLLCGTVDEVPGTFDLVLANLGGELLLDGAAAVAARAAPGGHLVLAGPLGGWADALADAYGALGCRELARRLPGGFAAALLVREP